MFCPHCGAALSADAAQCPNCRHWVAVSPAPSDDVTAFTSQDRPVSADASTDTAYVRSRAREADVTSLGIATATPPPPPLPGTPPPPTPRPATSSQSGVRPATILRTDTGPLAAGTAFGSRYHIIRMLGIGGMGAVYQAWDDALGVAVALKIIRPEISSDPDAARDLERRFKRELLLARQVTHKNVVRIHDLGEIDGIKYLTMPYIQGSDLATILAKEGKLPVTRAVTLAKQIVSGLQAAHEAGVVHRDLKPANIMVDADDQAVIMDFGIARSVSGGATMAGAVVGTLEYMAPEQAMARPVDHRADIYAFGLILYDMVLGARKAARAESAVAELMARVQNPLVRARTIDASIPEALERIIDQCTQPDPAARYQTTSELAQDLALVDSAGRPTSVSALSARPISRTTGPIAVAPAKATRWPWIACGAAVLVAAVSVVALLRPGLFRSTPSAGDANTVTSLAVLPFRNAGNDATLDWLGKILADMIRTELGEAPGLRIVPSDRLSQILSDLRVSSDMELDTATLGRIADSSNTQVLIAGQYARAGSAIRLQATLQGPNRPGSTVSAEAAGDADVPTAAKTLARALRERIAAPVAAVAGVTRSTLPGPTSNSIAALKAYSEGEQLARSNKHLDALKRFETATKDDSTFALAYARLAQTYQRLGYSREAEQNARIAADLSAKLPEEHRLLIDALRASIANNTDKAIEAYEQLRNRAPNDTQLLVELARLYDTKGNFEAAHAAYQQVLDLDPKFVSALIAIGAVEIRQRNFDAALSHLQPAFSEAVQTGNEPAKGAALHAMGVAFKRLNRPADALNNYEQALKIRRAIGDRRGMAATLTEMGQVQRTLQHYEASIASYDESLKISREIGDRQGVGNALIGVGLVHELREEYDKALDFYRQSLQIQQDLGNQAYQGLCLNNIATIRVHLGEYDDALTYFQQALQIREKTRVPSDIAETLQGLGDTQSAIGQLDEALSTYLKALELRRKVNDTRGTAIASASMAGVFALRGRYAAALDAYEDALKTFRGSKESRWLAEILNGYSVTLVSFGRTEPARQAIDEAAGLARELKNSRLMALAFNARGDGAYYRGDYRAARTAFEEAVRVAKTARNPQVELLSNINLAKAEIKEGRARAAVPKLRQLAARAETLRLRPLVAEATLHLGEALVATKQYAAARGELETALSVAEKLALQPVAANAHFLLATVLRQSDDKAGAARHLAEAKQLLDAMRKDARTDELLARDDLRRIAAATPTAF